MTGTQNVEQAADEVAALAALLNAGERAGRPAENADALVLSHREARGLASLLQGVDARLRALARAGDPAKNP